MKNSKNNNIILGLGLSNDRKKGTKSKISLRFSNLYSTKVLLCPSKTMHITKKTPALFLKLKTDRAVRN